MATKKNRTTAPQERPARRERKLREGLRKALVVYLTVAMTCTPSPEMAYALEETFGSGEDPQALTDASNATQEELEQRSEEEQAEVAEIRERLTSVMEAPEEPAAQEEVAEVVEVPAEQPEPEVAAQEPQSLIVETDDPNIVTRRLFGSDTNAGWTLFADGTLAITGTGVINEARPWGDYVKDIRVVYMDQTVRTASMALWFEGCENLTVLTGTWNLEYTKDLGGMFKDCTSLTGMNLSAWDVTGVEKFDGMFYGCSNLSALELSSWNMQNAQNTNAMFQGCPNLRLLVLGAGWRFVGETDLPNPPYDNVWGGLWQAVAGNDLLDPQGDVYTAYDLQQVWDGTTMAGAYVWESATHRAQREIQEAYEAYTLTEALALANGTQAPQTEEVFTFSEDLAQAENTRYMNSLAEQEEAQQQVEEAPTEEQGEAPEQANNAEGDEGDQGPSEDENQVGGYLAGYLCRANLPSRRA